MYSVRQILIKEILIRLFLFYVSFTTFWIHLDFRFMFWKKMQVILVCTVYSKIWFQMCSRINNVTMMLTCLKWYHHCLGNAFGIYGDLSVKQNRKYLQTSFNSTDMLRSGMYLSVQHVEEFIPFEKSNMLISKFIHIYLSLIVAEAL